MLAQSQVRWSTMATILASIAVAALIGAAVVTLRDALLWLFIAFFISVVLSPIVEALSAYVPRAAAVALTTLAGLAVMTGTALLIVPPFVRQVEELFTSGPALVEKLGRSPGFQQLEARFHLVEALNRSLRDLPGYLAGAASPVLHIVGGVFRFWLAAVSVFFLTLFMLLGGKAALSSFLALLHPFARARFERLGLAVYWATARYALGTGAIALMAGAVATITFAVAGVPYFLPLGVTLVFLDLIPVAGFIMGGVLMTVLTGATVGWLRALIVLAVFIIYQTLESHLLLPLVHRRTVRVSALGIVVALLVGLELGGVLGVLLAVPVAGAVGIVVRELLAVRSAPTGSRERTPVPPQAPDETDHMQPH